MKYQGVKLPENPDWSDLKSITEDIKTILITIITVLADRYESDPDYPFIDTKIDLLTGEDFPPDDPLRGKNVIYGWIQGRGLEALAGHCRWLRRLSMEGPLRARLEAMMEAVLATLLAIKEKNNGHFYFTMTPAGEPIAIDGAGNRKAVSLRQDSPSNFSDLFCAKGICAAACYLGERAIAKKARAFCLRIDRAIREGRFKSDQRSFDPNNPVTEQPAQYSHGPYMIQIGAASLFAEKGLPESVAMGLRLIRHERDRHVNLNRRIPEFMAFDHWETNDEERKPHVANGRVLSDPGHALEWVGLSLKFTALVKANFNLTADQLSEIQEMEALLVRVMERNFNNGFRAEPGGICKSFDLLSRHPLNVEMPWWSLPEAARASLLAYRVAEKDGDRDLCLEIFGKCYNAFIGNYILPERGLMAIQTLSEEGKAVSVIPATPDADPGYHTGLCLIDILDVIHNGN